jgi:hypothetical protein
LPSLSLACEKIEGLSLAYGLLWVYFLGLSLAF